MRDVGVDGVRDDIEGERDGLDEESGTPGSSELLPSPLAPSQLLVFSELLTILSLALPSPVFEFLLDPLPLPLPLADPLSLPSSSSPLNNPAPQSSPRSVLKWKLSLGGNAFTFVSLLSITSGGVGLKCLFNSAGSMSVLGRGRDISVYSEDDVASTEAEISRMESSSAYPSSSWTCLTSSSNALVPLSSLSRHDFSAFSRGNFELLSGELYAGGGDPSLTFATWNTLRGGVRGGALRTVCGVVPYGCGRSVDGCDVGKL